MTRWIFPFLVAAVFTAACSRPMTRSYYTLSHRDQIAKFRQSHPITVRVQEAMLRESYRRSELVFRPDVHEIRYDRRHRWSARPQKMVTAVVMEQLRGTGLVQQVTPAIASTPPNFTLATEVEAIEQAIAGDQAYAHLAITWRLVRFDDDQVVWNWRSDTRRPVGPTASASVRATVRTLNEMLENEFGRAVEDMAQYLAHPKTPRLDSGRYTVSKTAVPAADGRILNDYVAGHPVNDLPQVHADETPLGVGFGAIFIPALSNSDREPKVAVYGRGDGAKLVEGTMGRRIVLEPGDYTIRFGSGAVDQQISHDVRVRDGLTTVVPPTWSVLRVNVVDDKSLPFRGAYELIRLETREDYGLGLGADQQQGEEVRAWVLPPGLYKLILPGGTYRDRTDFATVRLVAGTFSPFTLVLDPDDGHFLGAGEVDPKETEEAESKRWSWRGVLGGNVAFTRRDEAIDAQEGWSLGLSAFFDGAVRFQDGPDTWDTRLDLEESQSRDPAAEHFTNEKDRLFLNSIYTHRLVPWFGPYLRGLVETSLLPTHQDFEEPVVVREDGPDGVCTQLFGAAVDRIQLSGPLSPLELRQSAGGNFRLLRTGSIELDLRLGLAVQETLANGLVDYEDGCISPQPNSFPVGPEGTLVGFFRLSRAVTISSEFDGLLPFNDEEKDFSWRNQVSVRLTSFLSLSYRLNVEYEPLFDEELQVEHDVQVRFSYPLF